MSMFITTDSISMDCRKKALRICEVMIGKLKLRYNCVRSFIPSKLSHCKKTLFDCSFKNFTIFYLKNVQLDVF